METRSHICTHDCFTIIRDNVRLTVRECKRKIARDAIAEHRRLKARRALWNGKEKR